MRDCVAVQIHLDQCVLGLFGPFANRIGNFVGFAKTPANLAAPITSHDQGAEMESPATFDNLGAAVYEYNLLNQLAFASFEFNTELLGGSDR